MTERARVLAGLGAEVSFGVLPLLVVLFALLHSGHANKMFSAAEWSFGASILFGQGLVKFAVGIGRGGSAATGPVALALALLIVFGLAPSLLTLLMVLQSLETKTEVSTWLRVAQVVLFLASVVTYLVYGTVGELWRRTPREPGL
jgi:uncharacterized membrane protein